MTTTNSGTISIILVNWNTRDMLLGCIQSIYDTSAGLDLQIVVVDNNSRDGSREAVASRFSDAVVVNTGGNIGFGKANNRGLELATGEFILYLNPDTIILPGALARMKQALEADNQIALVGPLMTWPDGQLQTFGTQLSLTPLLMQLLLITFFTEKAKYRFKKLFRIQDPATSGYVEQLCGGCIMARRATIDRYGSFDERFFMFSEDRELCYRMRSHDLKNYYCSEAQIIHIGGGSTEQIYKPFTTLMMCESTVKYIDKYHGAAGTTIYKAVLFFMASLKLICATAAIAAATLLRRGDAKKEPLFQSLKKQSLTLRWIAGLEKPVIAT